jgi:hypothetical protein
MWVRKMLPSVLVLGFLLLTAVPAFAAVPYVRGTYQVPSRQGTIAFTPQRAIQSGYEGKFVIDGKTYPGSYYAIRGTSNIGMVWYYGSSGIQAGAAVVSPIGGTSYAGTITFTDRQGNVTASGTSNVTITAK